MEIAKRVDQILYDSVFRNDEIQDGKPIDETQLVKVQGVVRWFGFHKDRLKSHAEEIKSFLQEMPSQFHKGQGDGWSFLNLPNDKRGDQWGEQINAESLFALASGLGMAKFTMPKEMWDVLPGGMPYVVFDVNGGVQ